MSHETPKAGQRAGDFKCRVDIYFQLELEQKQAQTDEVCKWNEIIVMEMKWFTGRHVKMVGDFTLPKMQREKLRGRRWWIFLQVDAMVSFSAEGTFSCWKETDAPTSSGCCETLNLLQISAKIWRRCCAGHSSVWLPTIQTVLASV